MTPTAGQASRSTRFIVAVAVLIAFNAAAAAIALVLAGGLPASQIVFATWFVGDVLVGLVALGLTERW
jgi:uncharacterized protein (DUF2062 family)